MELRNGTTYQRRKRHLRQSQRSPPSSWQPSQLTREDSYDGYDVPSTFVNSDVDEEVIMVLKGDLAEMMIQVAPDVYRKYVAMDKKGTKVLYVKLQKALYGLMRTSLLFYRKSRRELEAWGFTINP